ncbi:hypothetical protein K438DRAFT_1608812, partial [Mycena galopus ATCC 62051]
YEDPDVFNGLKMREVCCRRNFQPVATSADHVSFGHRRHACPGSHNVVHMACANSLMLKAMLAHLVLNYDLREEVDGVRPPDVVLGAVAMPNGKAKVWVQKRQ